MISGTPSTAGTTNFEVEVTSNGQTATAALAITIDLPAPAVTTSSPMPNGTEGVAYSETLTASGGDGTYTWALFNATTLPAGLALNTTTGVISGTPSTAGTTNFEVEVTSNGQTATAALAITIDLPAPAVTTSSPMPNGTEGVAYSETLTASGGDGTYTWALFNATTLPAGLALNTTTGVISGTPSTAGTTNFEVEVTSNGQTATAALAITIDLPAPAVTTSSPMPNGTEGVAYSETLTASGGDGTYTWALFNATTLPAGLALNTTTGVISGTPSTAGTTNFEVEVTSNGQTATAALAITIDLPAPAVTTSSPMPNGTEGVAYSETLTASGGDGTYTWALFNATTLPAGLALNTTTGVISGTPSTAGTTNFEVEVTSNGQTATAALAITIDLPAPAVTTSSPMPNGTEGVAYSETLTASGGDGTYTWALFNATTLPAGLALNTTTGVISGTPSTAGTTNFEVEVTSNGQTATAALAITIDLPAPAVTTSSPMPNGTEGVAYSETLTASGGDGTYTWALFNATTLPAGLALNTTTGVISGTPSTAGTTNFEVEVTSNGQTATAALAITIDLPAPAVTTSSPMPNGTEGVAYSETLTASGGDGTYTWALFNATTLPAGLALNTTTGVISGTPSTAGTTNFEVEVTSNGQTATAALAITIDLPAPAVTTSSPMPNGTEGVAYSETLTASGGDGTYTWALFNATTLPAGLALNTTTGVISGTPSTAGTTNFEVEVTSNGQTATAALAITIDLPAPAVTTSSPMPNGTEGVAYSETLTASGGDGTYTWALFNATTLPAGLALNTTTGVISGTPSTAGTTNFEVEVTSNGQTATAALAITIDLPAPAVTTSSPMPNGTEGVAYSETLTASGGDGTYTWALFNATTLPAGLALNTTTGVISGTPSTAGTTNFEVEVTSNGQTATAALAITIDLPAPAVTTSSPMPNGTEGVAYSETLTASGGDGTYTWALFNATTLPAGLALNTTTGVISGTPSTAGTTNFEVEVTSNGQTATAALAITIDLPAPAVTTSSPMPNGTEGVAYSETLTASGGDGTYTWALFNATTLPAGLALNTTTGVISGTPSTAGTTNFEVEVTSNGQTATAALAITIDLPAPAVTTSSPMPNGTEGVAYSETLTASGGDGTYTWALFNATTLPAGLALNTTTGVISGTPSTAGTTNFEVEVTSNGQTATAALAITIDLPAPAVTTSSPMPNGTEGVAYSETLTASGGDGTYTWALFNATTLPAGLALNTTTGVIGGTPSTAGTTNFEVEVTSNGQTATAALAITIDLPAPAVTTSSPMPNGTEGVAYSETLTASGGDGTYTWALFNATTLPAGLALNTTTGVISGAPSTAGTTNFEVEVTSNGQTATAALAITIDLPAPAVTTSSPMPNGTEGVAYSETLTASGGDGTYTWALFNATTLPAGLALNTTTGVISGTPSTAGTTNFEVEVTSNGQTATAALAITIDLPAPAVTTSSPMPNGTEGVAYSETLTASGGDGTYTWALFNATTLPAGLALNTTTGVISGTPSTAGTTNFEVEVTSNGQTATAALAITIDLPAPAVTTSSPMPNGTEGVAYSETLTASGGDGTYTWALFNATTLPAGLALNTTTGVISGTPSTAGTTNFEVEVTSNGQTATAALAITIDLPAPAVTTSSPMPNGTEGVAYSETLTASGGDGTYTWALFNATTLPAGLALNTTTGVISGTPSTAGTTNFEVEVTSNGQTATAALAITIDLPAPAVTTSSPMPNGTEGVAYSETLTASGGDGTYTWALFNATTLPAGLALQTLRPA